MTNLDIEVKKAFFNYFYKINLGYWAFDHFVSSFSYSLLNWL